MKFLALLVFFFYSAALYSTDILTRPVPGIASDSTGTLKTVAHRNHPTSHGSAAIALFESSVQQLYNTIGLGKYNLSYDVFRLAMIGYTSLEQQGKLAGKRLLSIIDFTKPSTAKRFYTIDLEKGVVRYHTYVSHGRTTGDNYAKTFSNKAHSNASSLGFFVTGETYVGSKGYSLKLDGMEDGYNERVRERAVVIHDADYVSEKWIRQYGRLGRSQGCPALPKTVSKKIIDTIKNRTAIFAYYNDENYLADSDFLKIENVIPSIQSQQTLTAE